MDEKCRHHDAELNEENGRYICKDCDIELIPFEEICMERVNDKDSKLLSGEELYQETVKYLDEYMEGK